MLILNLPLLATGTVSLFFFNDTATTEIYTLSLHDALPICSSTRAICCRPWSAVSLPRSALASRSEEHTSELQSHLNLVCRLLLEKNKRYQAKIQGYHQRLPQYIPYHAILHAPTRLDTGCHR